MTSLLPKKLLPGLNLRIAAIPHRIPSSVGPPSLHRQVPSPILAGDKQS